jgi:hypothetical protein
VTFEDEQPAWAEPTGACACCGTRVLAEPSNAVFVLYRSAATPANRDIYLLESNDRGVTFRGSRVQGWQIGTCPMSSMSLVSSNGHVLAAWETAGQVYWGDVDGRSSEVPTPIPAPGDGSTRKNPRLALNARTNSLLVWTEGTAWARGGSLAWQVFDPAGTAIGPRGRADGVPTWSFAAAVERPDGGYVILY